MYNLELEKAVDKIKRENAKLVCIQLADGLKPKAKEIAEKLEAETGAEVVIWMSSCFGACDIPKHIGKLGFDLLIQFGHSEWINNA